MSEDNSLTLEKARVVERLATVEQQISFLDKSVNACIGRLDTMLSKHDETLYGNSKAGMVTLMDRLTESDKRRSWMDRLGITTFAGLLVKIIADWIKP